MRTTLGLCVILAFGVENGFNVGLTPDKLIRESNYSVEYHKIITDDGYILTTHRIPYKNTNSNGFGLPVLVWPGLFCSSAEFVVLGTNSIGILLAKNGFDVWLANQRGTKFGREHRNYDVDTHPERFFNYSFHEVGVYDISNTIDYILRVTRYDRLLFLGYSQGIQSLLITLSLRPEYNRKIIFATGIGPSSYQGHTRSYMFRLSANFNKMLENFLYTNKIYEVSYLQMFTNLAATFCSTRSQNTNVCLWGIKFVAGMDNLIQPEMVPRLFENFPAGASTKIMLHIAQIVKSNRFCQYDYGPKRNLQFYGQSYPPSYNLSKVTIPIKLITSTNDLIADYRDVERIEKELPNVVEVIKLKDLNHLEFVWSYKAKELVYDNVIADFKKIAKDYRNKLKHPQIMNQIGFFKMIGGITILQCLGGIIEEVRTIEDEIKDEHN